MMMADEHGMCGKGMKFERIRRITGYLVGTIDRFNNAKRKELADRVKHDGGMIAASDGQPQA